MLLVLTAAVALTILFVGAVFPAPGVSTGADGAQGFARGRLRSETGGRGSGKSRVGAVPPAYGFAGSAAAVDERCMSVHRPPVQITHGMPASLRPELSLASVDALVQLLHQLAALIAALSDAQYIRCPVGPMESSIGGHLRHNLDHIRALLEGIDRGVIDYDDRERGTDVETDRSAAAREIARLEAKLRGISAVMLAQPITLRYLPAVDARPVTVTSTIARELAFVQSHTIHHNAMIAAMAALLEAAVPPRFGYAPATLAYLDQAACAPLPSFR